MDLGRKGGEGCGNRVYLRGTEVPSTPALPGLRVTLAARSHTPAGSNPGPAPCLAAWYKCACTRLHMRTQS